MKRHQVFISSDFTHVHHFISSSGLGLPVCSDSAQMDFRWQGLGMEVCSQNVGKTDAGAFTGGADREFKVHLECNIYMQRKE